MPKKVVSGPLVYTMLQRPRLKMAPASLIYGLKAFQGINVQRLGKEVKERGDHVWEILLARPVRSSMSLARFWPHGVAEGRLGNEFSDQLSVFAIKRKH
jgi:hypothetical protein